MTHTFQYVNFCPILDPQKETRVLIGDDLFNYCRSGETMLGTPPTGEWAETMVFLALNPSWLRKSTFADFVLPQSKCSFLRELLSKSTGFFWMCHLKPARGMISNNHGQVICKKKKPQAQDSLRSVWQTPGHPVGSWMVIPPTMVILRLAHPHIHTCVYIYICIYVNICILLPVFDGNNIGSRYITSPCRRTARCPGISAFCIAWMAQLQSWVNICQCQGGCDIPIHIYIYW